MASSSGAPLHEMVKPLAWLIGRWKAVQGEAHYPTTKDFTFVDEMEFFHVGQPNIEFRCYAFHPETKEPLHREVGFLRMKPESNMVAFLCAQNLGAVEMEEGLVNGQELTLESHTIGRMSFSTPPATEKITRMFCRHGDELEQVVHVGTSRTPLTEHLRTTYNKIG